MTESMLGHMQHYIQETVGKLAEVAGQPDKDFVGSKIVNNFVDMRFRMLDTVDKRCIQMG